MLRAGTAILFFTSVVLTIGCSGSMKYAKKAGKLDDAGLYAEAADMYLQSVQRNKTNVDAKIGLKKTGQMVLNDKLSEFFKAFGMQDAKATAVSTFLEAQDYQERIARQGVVLEIADHYRTDFEEVKGAYLVELYNDGQALLDIQDFPGAERKFKEIAKLEPGYKDASSLSSIAYMEPLYRAAKVDMEAKRYRKAYAALNSVVSKDASYKDAGLLRQECLLKGQYTLAVLPFTEAGNASTTASKLQAYAMTTLTESSDPFLKIVDRENMERILEEQRLGLSGVVDEQTAAQVGNLMGAKAVLMGEVVEYREVPGRPRKETRQGYESYKVERKNAEGENFYETKYKQVQYLEFQQENKVMVSFSFRLVSLETGEVLVSKVIDRNATDFIHYATYSGDQRLLLPTHNGVVDTRYAARNELRSLLSAKKEVKSIPALSTDALRAVSNEMANMVQQDLNSKIP